MLTLYEMSFFFIGKDLEKVLYELRLANVLGNMEDKTKTCLDLLQKAELQNLCRQYNLPTKGTNEQLRVRILEWAKETGTQLNVSIEFAMTCEETTFSIFLIQLINETVYHMEKCLFVLRNIKSFIQYLNT